MLLHKNVSSALLWTVEGPFDDAPKETKTDEKVLKIFICKKKKEKRCNIIFTPQLTSEGLGMRWQKFSQMLKSFFPNFLGDQTEKLNINVSLIGAKALFQNYGARNVLIHFQI